MAPFGIYDGGKADPKHRRFQAFEVRRPGGNPFTPSMPILPGHPIPAGVDNYSYSIKRSSPSTSPSSSPNASDRNAVSDGPHSNTREKRVRKQTKKAFEAAAAARGVRKRSFSSSSASASSPSPKKQKTDSRPPARLKLRNPDWVPPKPYGFEGFKQQGLALREERQRREAEAHKAWLEKSAAESEDDDDSLIDTPLQGFVPLASGHGGSVASGAGEDTESNGESTEPDEEVMREEVEAAHLLLALREQERQERMETARSLLTLRRGLEQERQERMTLLTLSWVCAMGRRM